MYLHTSIHRMSVPPPAVVLVSKIALAAVVTAIAAAFMIAAPLTVMAPIASVVAAGSIGALAVAAIDRRLSARREAKATGLATERIGIQGAVGIGSLALLLFALVSPADLRIVLASAGLIGLLGIRLAAADAGYARRGSAWTHAPAQQSR